MPYKFNPFTGNLDIEGPVLTGIGTVSSAADGTAQVPGINFANDLDTGIYRTGVNALAFTTGGTGKLFIDSSGTVQIPGSLMIGGTAAANTIDIYEEGTFTPTLIFSTSGSVTYATQEGYYTLIGNQAFVHLTIITNSVSSPTGDVTIGGLPASIAIGTTGFFPQQFGDGKIANSNIATENRLLKIIASGDSSTNSLLVYKDSDYTSQLQGSDLADGGNKNAIRLSLVYAI